MLQNPNIEPLVVHYKISIFPDISRNEGDIILL